MVNADYFNISDEFKKNVNDQKTFNLFTEGELYGISDNTAKKIKDFMDSFDNKRGDLKFAAEAILSILNYRNLSYIDLKDNDMFIKFNDDFEVYSRNFDIVRYRKKYIFFNNVVRYVVSEVLNVDNDNNVKISDTVIPGFKIQESPVFVMKEGTNNILSGKVIMKMRLSGEFIDLNQKNIALDNPNPALCINHINFMDGVNLVIKVITLDGKCYMPFVDDACVSQFTCKDGKKFEPLFSYSSKLDGMNVSEALSEIVVDSKEIIPELINNIE